MRIRAEFELLPCLCGFTLFHVIPQPSQRRAPAGVVTFGLIGMSYKTRVTDSHQRSRTHTMRAALMQAVHITGLQLPAHHGLEIADEVGDPRVYEQTRWIYFPDTRLPNETCGRRRLRPRSPTCRRRAGQSSSQLRGTVSRREWVDLSLSFPTIVPAVWDRRWLRRRERAERQ